MKGDDSVAYQKAYSFANRIVKAYRYLTEQKREYVLSKQLLRAGTSVGANLAEANGAVSKADFRNKVAIAYKEILESFGFAESPFRRNVGTLQRSLAKFIERQRIHRP